MSEREQIKEAFGRFVQGLEDNDGALLDAVLSPGCHMISETLGEASGAEDIRERLLWKGPKLDFSRYRIYNNCIFREGNEAAQSAYVVATVGVRRDGYLHWFTFGGHYLLGWQKENSGWNMRRIKYCHDMECGNTSFVAGRWKLIDYDVRNGYGNHPIQSQKEAPWRVMRDRTDWSEEEKIADLYNRYAWGIDEDDFELTASVMTDDIYSYIPGAPFRGKEKLLELLESKRRKENTMSHVGKIVDIKTDGDEAVMRIWRYEPHRIGTKFTHAGNIDTMFYSVDYLWKLKKLRGEWLVDEIDYNTGVFGERDDGKRYQ